MELLEEYIELKKQEKELKTKIEEMAGKVRLSMEEGKIDKKIVNEVYSLTYKEASKRVGIDTEKLKTEFEKVYLKCLKEIPTKASVTVKFKDEK